MPAQAGMQKILVIWIPACAEMPTLHLCEHLVGAAHFEFPGASRLNCLTTPSSTSIE